MNHETLISACGGDPLPLPNAAQFTAAVQAQDVVPPQPIPDLRDQQSGGEWTP